MIASSIIIEAVLLRQLMKANSPNPFLTQLRLPVLSLSLGLLTLIGCGDKPEQQAPPPPAVSVETARYVDVPIQTSLPGRVVAYEQAKVLPQVTGIIESQMFVEGGFVQQGQALFRIDTSTYKAEVDSQDAALNRAIANTASLKTQYERYLSLKNSNAISAQQLDDVKRQYDLARAEQEQAKANLSNAQTTLNRTVVRAPISGKTSRAYIDQGALVTAGSNTSMVDISQLDPVYVDMNQPIDQLMQLKKSQGASEIGMIRLKLGDSFYPASGRLMLSESQVNPETGSATIRAVFPNEDQTLLPGMYVNALVNQGTQKAVLLPQSAIQRTPKGDAQVYVIDQQDVAKVKPVVTSGLYQGKWIISEGLNPGDRVVVEGAMNVQPESPVTVQSASANQDGSAQPAQKASAESAQKPAQSNAESES